MVTRIVLVDPLNADPAAIGRAGEILRAGGLVAFPTETVYGLGANALDPEAVGRIFSAKGRPANNPVIVHTHDVDSARALTSAWPDTASRLAQRFWPGPLTLVLFKGEQIPAIVTAGGATVALRVPAHPVALALLRFCQLPLAAPSANRSARLSATCAGHVLADLDGRIDMLLDAGPAIGGLESTVLDLTASPARLLRPGLVSPSAIEALIGPIVVARPVGSGMRLRSPGMLDRHYAPKTPLECVPEDGGVQVRHLRANGSRVGWLTYVRPEKDEAGIATIVLSSDAAAYAAGLYAALHELDGAGLERIVVALPPDTEEWLAVRDRLKRASCTLGGKS